MFEAGLQGKILGGNTGKILEAIDNAEVFVDRAEISFPRIAVFGDESTGKSSVLEAICKIPFPRGKTTTTRCPTHIRLQRNPAVEWSATAWAGLEGARRKNETHVTAPEDITEVIRDLQSKEVEEANKKSSMRGGAEFSHVPITIAIEAKDTVDLTLVDLPGYFSHQALDNTTGHADVERIKQTLLKYLKDDHTILLVIVPANQLVKTANILNLLKEYESKLSASDSVSLRARTIYCFTKCDLVGTEKGLQTAPHDIEQIMSNKGPFAAKPHGWYAVVNNGTQGSESENFMTRISNDRQYENDYFDKNEPFNKVSIRPRCGIENLIQTLSSILAQEISSLVPNMLSQTDSVLSRAKEELKALGNAPGQGEDTDLTFNNITDVGFILGAEKLYKALQISGNYDIKKYYTQAAEGIYGRLEDEAKDVAPDISKDALGMCELGYIKSERFNLFVKQIKDARLPLEDDAYLDELRTKVEKARNGKFEATMPIPEVLFEEVRICAKKWKQIAEAMCNDIANAATLCLNVLVDVKAGKYERLPSLLKGYFEEMIEEQRKKAQNRLDWHYVDEIVRPNTLNEYFLKEYTEMKNVPGLGMDKAANRKAFVCNLEAYLPVAEARFIDNAVRTVTTHILDVPQGDRMTRVESEPAPKYVFQAAQIIQNESLEDLMVVRGDIGVKRESAEAKVEKLMKLREALLSQPSKNTLQTAENNAPANGTEATNGWNSGSP